MNDAYTNKNEKDAQSHTHTHPGANYTLIGSRINLKIFFIVDSNKSSAQSILFSSFSAVTRFAPFRRPGVAVPAYNGAQTAKLRRAGIRLHVNVFYSCDSHTHAHIKCKKNTWTNIYFLRAILISRKYKRTCTRDYRQNRSGRRSCNKVAVALQLFSRILSTGWKSEKIKTIIILI